MPATVKSRATARLAKPLACSSCSPPMVRLIPGGKRCASLSSSGCASLTTSDASTPATGKPDTRLVGEGVGVGEVGRDGLGLFGEGAQLLEILSAEAHRDGDAHRLAVLERPHVEPRARQARGERRLQRRYQVRRVVLVLHLDDE